MPNSTPHDLWNPPWEDPLLTCAELAERLRLKPATIRLWTRQGKIPVVRLGARAVRYRQRDVELALVNTSEVKV